MTGIWKPNEFEEKYPEQVKFYSFVAGVISTLAILTVAGIITTVLSFLL